MAKKVRKKLKWWGWLLISLSIIIVLTGSGVLVGLHVHSLTADDITPVDENTNSFSYLGVKPEGKKISVEIPEEKEDIIALAATLYNLGAMNCKNAKYLAVYNNCHSVFSLNKLNNYIDVIVFMIKDQNSYLREEYHLKNNIPLFEVFPSLEVAINNMVEMVTSERQYHTKGMEHSIYQRVLNNHYAENGAPIADWSNPSLEEFRDIPIYNKNQEGIFELTQHNITNDTIVNASVEYLENDQCYKVAFELDTQNPLTTQKSIKPIREGSGDKKANFTNIEIEFLLWDNGYFKNLKINEKWSARVLLPVKCSFANDFSFSYNKADVYIKPFTLNNSDKK